MALPASQAFGRINIELHKEAQVSTQYTLLGDIASISPTGEKAELLAATRIASSPEPGKERTLKAASIIESLRHAKHAAEIKWGGADSVIVTRKSQVITQQQMKQIVAQYIGRNLQKLPDAEIRFTSVRAPENIVLPTGKLTYTIRSSRPTIIGSSSFNILFKVDGKNVRNCTVRGKLEALAAVATAAVNIRRGSIITPDKVEMVRQDISRLDTPYFSMDSVLGLQAKRTIRAGRPLGSMNVAPPPVVRKGEPVKIIASRGALQISTKGIATMDGRPGDFIRVKNISSSKLVYCKVDAPGIVSVEF